MQLELVPLAARQGSQLRSLGMQCLALEIGEPDHATHQAYNQIPTLVYNKSLMKIHTTKWWTNDKRLELRSNDEGMMNNITRKRDKQRKGQSKEPCEVYKSSKNLEGKEKKSP